MLEDIFDAIRDWQIDGLVCRSLETADMKVAITDLPLRVLVPITDAEGEFIAIGTLNGTTWEIHDVLLWAPVMQGAGLHQFSREMVKYIEDYITYVKAHRSPTSNSVIERWTIKMGPIAWESADADYWGVDIALQIEEYS